jgi:hypothetical protein
MKSLVFVELDCDVYRLTRWEGVRNGTAVGGWASRWASNTTLTGSTNVALPAGKGARVLRTGGDDHTFWAWGQAPALFDASAIALLRANAAGATIRMGLVLRGSGALNSEGGYVLEATADALTLYRAEAGSFTELASVETEVLEEANYYFRLDTFDTSDGVLLRAKQWQGTLSDEPEEFIVSFADEAGSPAMPAGLSGLYGFDDGADFTCGLFRVRSLHGSTEETLRFAAPEFYLPKHIEAIPSIKGLAIQPATISLGENLGQRASINVTLSDHKASDLGELYNLGTFFSRFKARKLFRRGQAARVIHGLLGQPIGDMETRHYISESFDGPDPQTGTFSLVLKDFLKLADDERAQAPALSNGRLAGSIDEEDTAATLEPTDVGDQYPESGHVCIGGNEVCAFTRIGDSLTLTRGALGSTASSHNADERVQLVLYYPGNDAADIVYDLLTGYTDVTADLIPLEDWQAETAANLNVIYTAVITEPTSVKKLLSELVEQAALALFSDDLARLIRLQVLKPVGTNAATFDEDVIVEGSLTTREQPDKRISQIWNFYSRRDPTKSVDDEDNYRNALARVDFERELEYGAQSIRKVKARWIGTETSADRLNQVQLSRFRDAPRRFTFRVFRGTDVQPCGGYRLKWWGDVDESGNRRENGTAIQVTQVRSEADMIHVEAEEMLASGVIVLRHTVILTVTGSLLQWEVPDTFNPLDNIIEVLGGGGGGDRHGGGGGAYAAVSNLFLLPGSSVPYRVGARGNGQVLQFGAGQSSTNGGDSWFGASTFGASNVAAKGGLRGDAGRHGGQAADSIGDEKFSGGRGGNDSDGGGGGGGGAAAGPHGDGGDGGNGESGNAAGGGGGAGGGADGGGDGENSRSGNSNNAARGGNNRFGVGRGVPGAPNGLNGAGGAGNGEFDEVQPGNGSVEELWTQTISPIFSAGPGSGPGAGGERSNGVDAPNYGAGGSGRGAHGTRAGSGSQGLIAISWTEGEPPGGSPGDPSPGDPPVPMSAVFASANSNSSNPQNTTTRTAQALGAEDPTRRIVMLIRSGNANLVNDSNGVTSVTVAGVALRKVDQNPTTSLINWSTWISEPTSDGGPSGAEGTVSVTRSIGNGFEFVGWMLFATYDQQSASVIDTVLAGTSPTASGSIDLPADGACLAIAWHGSPSSTPFTFGGELTGRGVADQTAGVGPSHRIGGALVSPTVADPGATISVTASGVGAGLYAVTFQ